MARVTLNNETYNAATSGSTISGGTGTEQVNVFAGVTGLDVAGNVERVDLPGNIADFTFSSFGNSLTIRDGSGNIVASISDAGGKDVVFEDGKLDVAFDSTTSTLTVGGVTVGSTAAAITPAASAIDTTITSDSPDAGTGGGGTGGGGTGSTFTLTDAVGEQVEGTSADEEFRAVLDENTGADADEGTLNVGDEIIGGGGNDELNVTVFNGDGAGGATAAIPAGAEISGIEVVNLKQADAQLAAVDSADFDGVEQLWQIDGVSGATVEVGAGVTAGFRDTDVAAADDVEAKNGVDAVAIALDGIGEGSTITVNETTADDVQMVTISGSVADDGSLGGTTASDDTSDFNLDMSGLADVQDLILSLTSAGVITYTASAGPTLTSADLGDSTGGITLDLSAEVDLETFNGGSGADTLTLDLGGLTADAVTVSMGAGNDTLDVNVATTPAANVDYNVMGGAGNDTLLITGGAVMSTIFDASEANFADGLISFMDFNGTEDVLNIVALNTPTDLSNTQLATIAGEASLFDAVESAAAALNLANGVTAFDYGSNAYILQTATGGAFSDGDGLIELVGFSIEDFDASNYFV